MYIYIYVCVYVCVYVNTYIYVYMCACTYLYIYIPHPSLTMFVSQPGLHTFDMRQSMSVGLSKSHGDLAMGMMHHKIGYPLVNSHITNWKITSSIGKSHCKWSFSIAILNYQRAYIQLVGGFKHSEKYELVNWNDYFQYMENKTCSKAPTRQYIYMYIYIYIIYIY